MAPFYGNYLEWNEKKNKRKYVYFCQSSIQFVFNFKWNFILFNKEIFNNSKLNIFCVTFT